MTSGNFIFENTVVGVYSDSDGVVHGFIKGQALEPSRPWFDDLLYNFINWITGWTTANVVKSR